MNREQASKLDEIAAAVPDWYDLASEIRANADVFEAEDVRALNVAFSYNLHVPKGRARQPSDYFKPLYQLDSGGWPPPPEKVPKRWCEIWKEVFLACSNDCVKARLGDLLWVSKAPPRPDRYAIAAIDAYLALEKMWDSITAPTCAARAIQIASELNNDDRRAKGIEAAATGAANELKKERPVPGFVFGYLRALTTTKHEHWPSELDSLLDLARVAYAADPWQLDNVFSFKCVLANGDDVALLLLRRERAETWEAAALSEAGLKRLAFLEKAIDIAKDIPDLRARLLVHRQKMRVEDLGLQEYSVTSSIDLSVYNRWLNHLLNTDSAIAAVERLIRLKPPTTGKAGESESSRNEGPLAFFATEHVLTADAVTVRHIDSADEHNENALAAEQRLQSEMAAKLVIAPFLDLLPIRFQGDTGSTIVGNFRNGLISREGRALAREALHAYWQGSPMTSGCILVPVIEHVARNLARTWHQPVLDQDARGYVPLNEILDLFKGHVDESWRQFLSFVLASKLGFNLRNQLAHGLSLSLSQSSASLMILSLLYLATIEVPRRDQHA